MAVNLVIVEHDGRSAKRASLGGLALAARMGGEAVILMAGAGARAAAESARRFGAVKILVTEHPDLAEPLADRHATLIAGAARGLGATCVVGTSSTYSKDVLPRVAALLDAPMLTDVTGVEAKEDGFEYERPLSAGSLSARVRIEGPVRVLTARGTAFQPPAEVAESSPIEELEVDASSMTRRTRFVSRDKPVSVRPELTEARVVVGGGRPLTDKATFERLIGGLADALGGAVGATRAAVDSGMAPNDWQIGQTGKVIAPELYIAVGISGSVQHWAGIKDSRVIVAVNRDPEAPIFKISTYGLVGDLHEVVPELTAAVRKG